MKKSVPALLGIAVIAAIVGGSMVLKPGPSFTHQKGDTAMVWVRYFSSIGATTKDTSSYAIRAIKDSFRREAEDTAGKGPDDLIKITKVWYRDTSYYVPYDTTVAVPTKADTAASIADTAHRKQWTGRKTFRLFVHIPKQWILQDYNQSIPLQQSVTK
jgi:hypothetical protein